MASARRSGNTPDRSHLGRPYFAMELVKGVPITEYCDTHWLDTRARLELLMLVCEGVQHAHRKGIIHRDIKASNVLVTVEGDKPVPKIIDFGIAKATDRKLTEATLFTELGQWVGTPAYMSPEQAEMTGLDIDTRTDVYSLGVLLYELLVGSLPFELDELRALGLEEIRRKIREEDPQKPSTRFKSLGDTSTQVAVQRHSDPSTLSRRLRGDLDWITMRALEKDRTRRYDSPAELAADIGRHLNNQPVEAGPPDAIYKLGKFVRRHRLAVASATTIAVLMVAFVVAMYMQSVRVEEQRDRAVEVANLLEELFEAPDPFTRGSDWNENLLVVDFLDKSEEKIRTELGQQPELQSHMLGVLGKVRRNLGNPERARPLLEQALEIQRELHGPAHEDVLELTTLLALTLREQDDFERAEQLLRDNIAVRRDQAGRNRGAMAKDLQGLGNVFQSKGEFDAAEEVYREALDLNEAEFGDGSHETARSQSNLATALIQKGDFDAAEPLLRSALIINRRESGNDSPDVLSNLNNLAYLLEEISRPDEAAQMHREALRIANAIFIPPHPAIARSLNNLGATLLSQRDYDGAEQYFRESLAMRRELYGDRSPAVGIGLSNLAATLNRQGDADAAEPLYEEALEVLVEVLGPDHPASR